MNTVIIMSDLCVFQDPLAAHYSFIGNPFTIPPYHELQVR